jgi:hypothetical protein
LWSLLVDLFFLCTSWWEYEFFLEFVPKYVPLDAMVIIDFVANHPFGDHPQNLK